MFTSGPVILTSEMSNDNELARSGGRAECFRVMGRNVQEELVRGGKTIDGDSRGAYWTPPGWREVRLTVSETISFLKG